MARRRDPQTGKLLPEGIHPQVSERTGKVTYRARVSYGPSNRRRHIGKTFKQVGAAKSWLLNTQMEINYGEIVDPSQVTCDEFFSAWFARRSKSWSGSRAFTVKRAWENYGRPVLGPIKVQSVRQSHVQQIADDMEDVGLKSGTVELYLIGYKSMFSSAIEERIIGSNPCNGVLITATPKDEKPVWTPDQLKIFLASEKDSMLFPFWAFIIGTGCRIGEAVAVQWEDINHDSMAVWIHRTVARLHDGTIEVVNRTKSGEEGRVITLEPWVLDALEELPRETVRVFQHITEVRRTYLMYRELGAAAERAGLPSVTPHGLRHASATAMAVNGIEEAIVQEILGHRSRDTTRRIYVHIQTENKRKGTAALASIIGQADTTTSVPKVVDFSTSASELRQNDDSENGKTG